MLIVLIAILIVDAVDVVDPTVACQLVVMIRADSNIREVDRISAGIQIAIQPCLIVRMILDGVLREWTRLQIGGTTAREFATKEGENFSIGAKESFSNTRTGRLLSKFDYSLW